MNSEAQLIASICKNKDISKAIEKDVAAKMQTHKDVMDWLKQYYFNHQDIPDLQLVAEEFPDMSGTEAPGTTSYYVDRIINDYTNHMIGRIIEGVAEKHGNIPAADLLGNIMSSVNYLARQSDIISDATLNDIDKTVRTLEHRQKRAEQFDGDIGISTGFGIWDTLYPTGMAPGHLITLIGWSSGGKSLAAGLLALRAWLQNRRVLFVSLEMSRQEVQDRIFTLMGKGKFKHSSLSRGDVDIEEFRQWAEGEVEGLEDFVIATPTGANGMTPSMIQSKIEQYNSEIVFVDYVQLMDSDGDSQSETVKLKNISRDFKMMAVANGVPIVMLSQATFNDPKDTDEPPMIEQVAWSKGILNDSDLAVAIHKYKGTNQVDIVARKNRHGELFAFELDWDINNGIIKEG